MMYMALIIDALLLLISVTSAEFNLNSLNTANKSLDTFNQSKITLNNNWDYKAAKDDDDPITLGEMIQQTQPYKTTENGKLLLNITRTTTTATTRRSTKRLRKHLSNQKLLKMANINKQQEPKNHQRDTNYFHHYLTAIKFNNGNNDNFNLNNKLKTITANTKHDDGDAKEVLQHFHNINESPAGHKNGEADNTKYAAAANSFSHDYYWLGQMPQFELQFFLQQQTLRHTASTPPPSSSSSLATSAAAALLSMAAASLLPPEYHHLADYSLFFNAERHTLFYLHTLTTTQNDYVTVATKQATATATATTQAAATGTLASSQQPDGHNRYENGYHSNNSNNNNSSNYANANNTDNDNAKHDDYETDQDGAAAIQMLNLTEARVLNTFTDTIAAAFGVTTRPVAAIHGIQIEEIELYNGPSLRQSRFNPFNPCRILIHGWLGGSKAGIYNTLVPEYLKLQQGVYNIFTVDWGRGAMADYITASYRVKPVGMTVAKFIDFLHQESGIAFENIHVIGFSMGAHIAGIAGKYVQTGRLPVIYGLDPALPLFRYENFQERLHASDANYVEVVHTSVGSYGYDHPLGQVDFYINFGYNQPGCFFNECSHFRAFTIFAQSLKNEILRGHECSTALWWDMIKHKRCLRHTGRSLRLGVEGLRAKDIHLRRGLYYVMTNAQPPYRMG